MKVLLTGSSGFIGGHLLKAARLGGAFTPKSGAAANDIAACNGNIAFTGMLLGVPMPALRKVVFLSTLDV